MQFNLTIRLSNDQMQTPADLSDALKELSLDLLNHTAGYPYEKITMGPDTRIAGGVRDANGNAVGHWDIQREESARSSYLDAPGLTSRANSALLQIEHILAQRHIDSAVQLVRVAEIMANEPVLTDGSTAAISARRAAGKR